ncbi:restriction endonuclease subunit S [Lachnospira pectinoschiza]|uniref:Type I restriction enzyme, S subunit n=1 Tax=Lachnospira pectinoschiza TaxID=28052 RepID=A0A1G9UGA4_9FIRM|nr:restriction endonuclease subunit S [Lachnospira pectinoschiza]SDM58951.1 type I restriction enzyme, S subunit [Lachnospira pectinoschiza]
MKEMKDSGLDWIGAIPVNWNIVPIKTVATCFGRIGFRGYTTEDLVDEGDGPITLSPTNIVDSKINLNKCSYLSWEKYYESPEIMVYPQDIIFVKTASVGKCAIYDSKELATINPQFVVFKDLKCNNRFLFYCLISDIVQGQIGLNNIGGVISTITQKNILNYKICIPSLNEQLRIADYLDLKCSQIDSIISKQEAIIEKLKEYKLSVITETVTKGVNSNVEMKDSGVEWISDIPIDWDEIKLKNCSYIRARLGWKGLKADEYVEEGYPLLSAFNIVNSKIDFENNINFINQERYDESPEIKLSEGDILLVKDGAGIGKCGIVENLPVPSTTNGSLAVITTDMKIESKFLYYYFLSSVFQRYIDRIKDGMGVPHLFQSDLREITIVLPPSDEQQLIIKYLDEKVDKVDVKIELATSMIGKLNEYKKSLIYEVVTGKMEV